jgi:hypothetical protein
MKRISIVISGVLALITITLCASIFLNKRFEQALAEASTPSWDRSEVMVVKHRPGTHGSVWKFRDANRECYFNSKGGIWCSDAGYYGSLKPKGTDY